ncbi:receptor-type tyrosine-protein phosphatase-like N [Corticium candelabrum]|uniref:receptor-type tyrosine-protein phosphatase-like N n=1 Tax=Corticium candelabrum TaxID=121492 RepID=UPI002E26BC4A|nr:receptor-type tyrosine-protein phosphatase-like N [Corticium candelabrum]
MALSRRLLVNIVLLCLLVGEGCSWRYGCGLLSFLCPPVDRCEYTTPLGICISAEEETAHHAVDQKVVPSVAANMVDSFGYDRHDQLQRVRTRVRVRSVELKEGKRHRMKRDAYRNGGSERYVYVMFDLEGCQSCVNEMTDSEAQNFVVKLANHMKVPDSLFLEISGNNNIVTFRIGNNGHDMQPEDIVQQISISKSGVEHITGYIIADVGTTDKPSSMMIQESIEEQSFNDVLMLLAYIGASVAVLGVVIFLLIFAIKRRTRSVKRLSPGTFHVYGHDDHQYVELCRNRFQVLDSDQLGMAKSPTEEIRISKLNTEFVSPCNEEQAKGHMDVNVGHIVLSYLEEHLKNTDKIDKEWQELCIYQCDQYSVDAALSPKNREKNRYQDVLPYDHSRVTLDIIDNQSNSDYINASYICDDNPWKPLHVATQGPLRGTVCDFWQMVWETRCTSIVMLTECCSLGLPQCHQYWPETESATYHIYQVHYSSEHALFHDYVVRDFYLKNLKTQESRTVTQFHFLSWPSLGVPQHPITLLEFRRRVNRSFSGQDSPIIVHDSAGIGRTGTYILIDMVLRRIEKTGSKLKQIDLAATVEHLRDQRMDMVKTKDQFEFAVKALAEEVKAIVLAMPSVGSANEKLVDNK